MKFLTAIIAGIAFLVTGCTATGQKALSTAETASDIQYVIHKYPEISTKVASIEVDKQKKKEFEESLKELQRSYAYFQNVDIQTVDVYKLANEYLVAKKTYIQIRSIIAEQQIDNVRLQVELEQFDTVVQRVDNDIMSFLKDNKQVNEQSVNAVKEIVRIIIPFVKIAVSAEG